MLMAALEDTPPRGLRTGTVTRDDELALDLMRCGFDNGDHRTMDVVVLEDESPPYQAFRGVHSDSQRSIVGYHAVSA